MSFLSTDSAIALARLAALDGAGDAEVALAPLERLAAIRGLLQALEADPASLQSVREALIVGASWEEIGGAALLKAAAAKWRWQGDDAEIAARHEAGRKRNGRSSSRPTDLPGLSIAEAAEQLGVTAQAIYLRVSRGQLRAETVTLPDGRSYKRVFPDLPGLPDLPGIPRHQSD